MPSFNAKFGLWFLEKSCIFDFHFWIRCRENHGTYKKQIKKTVIYNLFFVRQKLKQILEQTDSETRNYRKLLRNQNRNSALKLGTESQNRILNNFCL
jgi:hypothetical protein